MAEIIINKKHEFFNIKGFVKWIVYLLKTDKIDNIENIVSDKINRVNKDLILYDTYEYHVLLRILLEYKLYNCTWYCINAFSHLDLDKKTYNTLFLGDFNHKKTNIIDKLIKYSSGIPQCVKKNTFKWYLIIKELIHNKQYDLILHIFNTCNVYVLTGCGSLTDNKSHVQLVTYLQYFIIHHYNNNNPDKEKLNFIKDLLEIYVSRFNFDINTQNKNTYTIVHSAISHNCIELLEYLIDNYIIDWSIVSKKEKTYLHNLYKWVVHDHGSSHKIFELVHPYVKHLYDKEDINGCDGYEYLRYYTDEYNKKQFIKFINTNNADINDYPVFI